MGLTELINLINSVTGLVTYGAICTQAKPNPKKFNLYYASLLLKILILRDYPPHSLDTKCHRKASMAIFILLYQACHWFCSIIFQQFYYFKWSLKGIRVTNNHVAYCPGCRTYLILFDRNKILSGGDLSHYQVPHRIRVFFYFVWFVFLHHNFQFYFELCTCCNILDIYLS